MKYFRPKNIAEYFEYIQPLGEGEFTILAGGTDLVPRYDQGRSLPKYLIDIKRIEELYGIYEWDDEVEIGASTTIEDLKRSASITSSFNALGMAVADFAGAQIRSRATIGGNICNASPAGDTLPALYVFNAELKILGAECERTVPIHSFIKNPGDVGLKHGELLKSIILPKVSHRSYFVKLGLRQAMAISVVNFALAYSMEKGNFTHLSIAVGSCAPTVVYLKKFADALLDNPPELNGAIELVDEDISPISDIRGSAEYRRTVLKNLLKYTITSIWEGEIER